MKKAVAIIGNGRTRVLAPHDDPAIDVWTLNDHAMQWNKHTDAVFEMHPDALAASRYSDEYKAWLQEPHPFPIYMHEVDERIPASTRFPKEGISRSWFPTIRKGGRRIENFYTSTVPYCLAMAIHMNYPKIKLYGVDLERDVHLHFKDAVFFYLGYAGARGVEIEIPEGSALMDEALYPILMPKRRKRQ